MIFESNDYFPYPIRHLNFQKIVENVCNNPFFFFICWLKLISHYNDNFITCYKPINGLSNFCFDCVIFDHTWLDFTWLKIMIPTKNSINDNDFFFIVMIDMYSKCHSMYFKWTYFCNRHSLHDLSRFVHHNELFLPRFIYENVNIMFIREFGVRKSFVYRIH